MTGTQENPFEPGLSSEDESPTKRVSQPEESQETPNYNSQDESDDPPEEGKVTQEVLESEEND